MIRRSTLIVVVLFIVAAAGLLILQKLPSNPFKPTETPAATSMPAMLSGWKVQDIAQLGKKHSDGTTIQLVKNTDASWTRVDKGPVPSGKVEQLLSELIATRIVAQLSAGQNLNDLGLQNPSDRIELHTSDNRITTLSVGAATPTQSGTYVIVDGGLPAVVDKTALDTILQLFEEAAPATPTPPASPAVTATPS